MCTNNSLRATIIQLTYSHRFLFIVCFSSEGLWFHFSPRDVRCLHHMKYSLTSKTYTKTGNFVLKCKKNMIFKAKQQCMKAFWFSIRFSFRKPFFDAVRLMSVAFSADCYSSKVIWCMRFAHKIFSFFPSDCLI